MKHVLLVFSMIWKKVKQFFSFFFPMISSPAAAKLAQETEDEVLNSLRGTNWLIGSDFLLEEARRLVDAELERRKTADVKAATYLAVVGVFVPIFASFEIAWDTPKEVALQWGLFLFLIAAIFYLLCAGYWAFKVLKVTTICRVDTEDLLQIWCTYSGADNRRDRLASELLQSVHLNRKPVNQKVTYIKMAHDYLLRAFLAFTFLLLIQISWVPGSMLIDFWLLPEITSNAFVSGPIICDI